jgi:hypothetical protein
VRGCVKVSKQEVVFMLFKGLDERNSRDA